MKQAWSAWTLRVFSVSLAVDVLLMALAGRIPDHSSCTSAGPSSTARFLAVVWLVVPPVALIVAGREDERTARTKDAEAYAMGAVAIIVLTHVLVALFFLRAGPSCGLLGG